MRDFLSVPCGPCAVERSGGMSLPGDLMHVKGARTVLFRSEGNSLALLGPCVGATILPLQDAWYPAPDARIVGVSAAYVICPQAL